MNEHTLKEDIFNILRILSSDDTLTQRDLSTHLGFSLGKTNYLLKELAKKGLVKIKNFSHKDHKLNPVRNTKSPREENKISNGVKRISYNLTPEGWKQKTELTLHFLKRKQEEYESLRREWEGSLSNATNKMRVC